MKPITNTSVAVTEYVPSVGREHADIHHWDAVGTETRKLADHRLTSVYGIVPRTSYRVSYAGSGWV